MMDPSTQPGVGFLFDENVPAAFAAALRLVGYKAYANVDVGLRGALDSDVIAYCGKHKLVWVTKDLDARKRAAYGAQVKALAVSASFVAPPRAKRWTMKEQFEVVARHIRTLEERYAAKWPRYYFLLGRGQPKEIARFSDRRRR
jgi:predicted nuclease of predicted toxin-antitoxin system